MSSIEGFDHLLGTMIPDLIVIRRGVVPLLLAWVATSAGTTAEAQKVRVLETPGKIRFGVLGDAAAGPAPTLFVIGGQLEATLNRIDEKNWNQVLRVVDHGVPVSYTHLRAHET